MFVCTCAPQYNSAPTNPFIMFIYPDSPGSVADTLLTIFIDDANKNTNSQRKFTPVLRALTFGTRLRSLKVNAMFERWNVLYLWYLFGVCNRPFATCICLPSLLGKRYESVCWNRCPWWPTQNGHQLLDDNSKRMFTVKMFKFRLTFHWLDFVIRIQPIACSTGNLYSNQCWMFSQHWCE